MSKLISFITPSRNLENCLEFLDNLERTAKHPERIEVLFKFDTDQEAKFKDRLDKAISTKPFPVKYIFTPRLEGIFSVWIACNQLFFMSSPDSYFIQILSDEVRFETMNWDLLLEKYIGFFPDHVFRLRMSDMKYANYYKMFECSIVPDCFPIYTRTWFEITEGTGDCWGSDAYQQAVAYFLGMGKYGYNSIWRQGAVYRDIPMNDIKFNAIEFAVGVEERERLIRHQWNIFGWNRLASHFHQEIFSYLAKRLYAYIWAVEHKIEKFQIIQVSKMKAVRVVDPDSGHVYFEETYAVPFIKVYYENFKRRLVTGTQTTLLLLYKILNKLFLKPAYNFYEAMPKTESIDRVITDAFHKITLGVFANKNDAIHCNTMLFRYDEKGKYGAVRRIIQFLRIRYYAYIPLNFLDKIFKSPAPGIHRVVGNDKLSFLKRKILHFSLKPLVVVPEEDKKFANEELARQDEQMAQLRNKVFEIKLKNTISQVNYNINSTEHKELEEANMG